MISVMKNATPQVTKNNRNQKMIHSFLGLLRSAANSLGEEFHKLGEAAKRGFTDTHRRRGAIHHNNRITAGAEDDEVVIVFQDKQHFMIEPEMLLFPSRRQDVEMFPTLQLLEAQTVKVLNPFDAILSVFRQQLIEDKINKKTLTLQKQDTTTNNITEQQRKLSPTKRMVRPLKKLMSSEEAQRRKAIERKLSMIRKGRFTLPPPTSPINNHQMMKSPMLLSTY